MLSLWWLIKGVILALSTSIKITRVDDWFDWFKGLSVPVKVVVALHMGDSCLLVVYILPISPPPPLPPRHYIRTHHHHRTNWHNHRAARTRTQSIPQTRPAPSERSARRHRALPPGWERGPVASRFRFRPRRWWCRFVCGGWWFLCTVNGCVANVVLLLFWGGVLGGEEEEEEEEGCCWRWYTAERWWYRARVRWVAVDWSAATKWHNPRPAWYYWRRRDGTRWVYNRTAFPSRWWRRADRSPSADCQTSWVAAPPIQISRAWIRSGRATVGAARGCGAAGRCSRACRARRRGWAVWFSGGGRPATPFDVGTPLVLLDPWGPLPCRFLRRWWRGERWGRREGRGFE